MHKRYSPVAGAVSQLRNPPPQMLNKLPIPLHHHQSISRPHIANDLNRYRPRPWSDLQYPPPRTVSIRVSREAKLSATARRQSILSNKPRERPRERPPTRQHCPRAGISLAKLPPKHPIVAQPLSHRPHILKAMASG